MNRDILPASQRFYAFIGLCLGVTLTSLYGAHQWGPIWGLLLPLPLLAIALILRWMFFPRFSGRTRVQLASLASLCLPAALYIPANPLIDLFVVWFSKVLELDEPIETFWVVSSIQVLLTLGVIGLNYIWHCADVSQAPENPDMSETSPAIDRDYDKSRDRYCGPLIRFLDRYDDEVNWSDRDLTPLEAEVETEQSNRLRPSIVKDLVSAIRRDRRSEVFVVLGDPGSGKSVSLRRLVRVLCEQASRTGVVPVYVNLREWKPELGKITSESLVAFAKDRAYEQTGRDGRAFLDTWYEAFRKSGRLFFVIDSFDELPSVLDCDDKSDLHREVSKAFDRFFTQEIRSCRAVLASRHFRSPVGLKGTRLIIRPFRESQIRNAMQTWLVGRGIDSKKYIRDLFRLRPQLVPLLRNPFTAELIAEYARTSPNQKLPDSGFEVFDHYIMNRLFADEPTFNRRYGLTASQIKEGAQAIAREMYDSKTGGLEASVEQVRKYLNCPDSGAIIESLKYSRIARVGGLDEKRFSFVHRRFAEFFVVGTIMYSNNWVALEAIPTDSRWRDCLVMYCDVSKPSERGRIAEFCWSEVKRNQHHFLRGDFRKSNSLVHCLRFLVDAFRIDSENTRRFQNELDEFLIKALKNKDLLVNKISAEALSLSKEEKQQVALSEALSSESPWVFETALDACRYVGKLNVKSEIQIRQYLREKPGIEKLRKFGEINFSLGLSDALSRQRVLFNVDVLFFLLLVIVTLLLLVNSLTYAPLLICWFVLLACLFFSGNILLQAFHPLYRNLLSFEGVNAYELIESLAKSLALYFGVLSLFSNLFVSSDLMHLSDILVDLYSQQISEVSSSQENIRYFYFDSGLILFVRVIITFLLFSIALGWDVVFHLFVKLFRCLSTILDGILNLDIASTLESIRRNFEKVEEAWIRAEEKIRLFRKVWKEISIFMSFSFLFMITIVWLSIVLPQPLKDIIIMAFGFLLLLVFLRISVPHSITYLRKTTKSLIGIYERYHLNKKGWPKNISCEIVYQKCLEFNSSETQRYYLESLRKLRIPLLGDVVDPPEEFFSSIAVEEELAKLREQWHGLSN